MYERNIGPEKAAKVVDQHILDALDDLEPGGTTGNAG
jgi:hypothetical protein